MKINAYLCSRKQQNKKDYARDLPLLRNRHHDVSARPPLGPWDACLSKNPPHFHVRYNEYRATIDIQTGEVTGQMPRRALHLVFDWLDQHKDELMENWKRMENGETLAKINPLD